LGEVFLLIRWPVRGSSPNDGPPLSLPPRSTRRNAAPKACSPANH